MVFTFSTHWLCHFYRFSRNRHGRGWLDFAMKEPCIVVYGRRKRNTYGKKNFSGNEKVQSYSVGTMGLSSRHCREKFADQTKRERKTWGIKLLCVTFVVVIFWLRNLFVFRATLSSLIWHGKERAFPFVVHIVRILIFKKSRISFQCSLLPCLDLSDVHHNESLNDESLA